MTHLPLVQTANRTWYNAAGPVEPGYVKDAIRTDILRFLAEVEGLPGTAAVPYRSRRSFAERTLRGELITATPAEAFDGTTVPDGEFAIGNVLVGHAIIRYGDYFVARLLTDPFDPPPLHGTYNIENIDDDSDAI